jgi:hypothetical protein
MIRPFHIVTFLLWTTNCYTQVRTNALSRLNLAEIAHINLSRF